MSVKYYANIFRRFSNTLTKISIPSQPNCRAIQTTSCKLDLKEFFEEPENWSKEEIKTGRSWRVTELRLKSNEDLHKLWFVLLKEKNMLLTMEHYCKENYILFPNPERIDKVEESMNSIETVVRERNRAYFELETGETGERPGRVIVDPIGMKHWRNLTQHYIPRWANKVWQRENPQNCDTKEVEHFLKLFKEKNIREKKSMAKQNKRYARGLLRRFPNIDMEYLKELYPNMDFEKELQKRSTDGHFERESSKVGN